MEIQIAPENLEVANLYLSNNSLQETASILSIPIERVSSILDSPDVRRYVDNVYLDTGYRNKHKLANLMDTILESKLEECKASEVYSNKDILEIAQAIHKMRLEELKLQQTNIGHQTNVQINEAPFGGGNYGELMKKLLE